MTNNLVIGNSNIRQLAAIQSDTIEKMMIFAK